MDALRADQYTKDLSDTKRALVQHAVSGARWIVEYCSLWDGDQVVPDLVCIIAASRELLYSDLPAHNASIESRESATVYDEIDAFPNLTDEDADWLQAEDEAGKLMYPFGAR